MAVHLVKLCVGINTIEQLANWRQRTGSYHITRNFPKRSEELLEAGSLYWIMQGKICARQKITGLKKIKDKEGRSACKIVLGKKIIPTQYKKHRPFQGWRYLKPEAAPKDIEARGAENLPEDMREELSRLGLI